MTKYTGYGIHNDILNELEELKGLAQLRANDLQRDAIARGMSQAAVDAYAYCQQRLMQDGCIKVLPVAETKYGALTLKRAPPQFAMYFSIYDLPAEHQQAVRNFGVYNTASMVENSDGSYFHPLDFSIVNLDKPSDAVVQQFGEDDSSYCNWLRALRYIAAQLPEELREYHRVAIQVTQ